MWQGTFSQRHAILADQTSERVAVPLQTLTSSPPSSSSSSIQPGTIEFVNSPLSEYAPLSFEQGLAYVSPKLLPLWEAQVRPFSLLPETELTTFGT